MKTLYLFGFFSFLNFLATAQTKLTILQRGRNMGIDEIKIEKFSNQKFLSHPIKDKITIEFEDKFADLYTLKFYSGSRLVHEFQGWLDTGNVKLIISKGKYEPVSIDTIENSPITDRARKFSMAFSELSHGTDSVKVNELMLETYKQNLANSFSFYVGEFYYSYNKNNTSNYLPLIKLETGQEGDSKQSLFYAMMLRRRFTFTEQRFFSYFKSNHFEDLFSGTIRKAFDTTKANVLLFLGEPTAKSIRALEDLNFKRQKLDSKIFNVVIAIDKKYATTWKSKLNNDGVPKIVVSDDELRRETTFLPVTKFYFVNGARRVSGYYDTMNEILKEAGVL